MRVKFFRRIFVKFFAFLSVFIIIRFLNGIGMYFDNGGSYNWDKCVALQNAEADIDTISEFTQFEFEPNWIRTKEYWDKDFEARYGKLMKNQSRPPLKIVVVPHSHNDPGWWKTFVDYFQSDSKQIIDVAVTKMSEYEKMTFIWSEISFLQMWWDQADPTKQRALKELIHQGRFEITTGGWVMTDEANAHVFAMVDQLIEGHQWVKSNLNITPKTGWSVDPFGHGSTVPYLLSSSGFEGTIIQRIHYAWKQWFARERSGDFEWLTFWQNPKKSKNSQIHSMLTHNMPFDLYSIKHSCGPHSSVCLNFDFQEMGNIMASQLISSHNIQEKADLLIEQYSKTASLLPHNMALIPVGDDFRYNKESEMEQQYTNYKKLFDYINANPVRYFNASISFGTPIDYFKAVKERSGTFPTLKGDFFSYSDIYVEGNPAYWSGYFTTRPFYKLMSRELEHNLRSLEILFTILFNQARQNQLSKVYNKCEEEFKKIIQARRNLGLFQHHDAITGTSREHVMKDYAFRLFQSIQDTVKLQQQTIESLIQAKDNSENNFVISEFERNNFNLLSRKTPIDVKPGKNVEIVLYNSLAQERIEVISVRSKSPNVKILDPNGDEVQYQINPVLKFDSRLIVSDKDFEIRFLAKLPGLTLSVFTATYGINSKSVMSTIHCDDCKDVKTEQSFKDRNDYVKYMQRQFEIKPKQSGDIKLENQKMQFLFDGDSGFLKLVKKKNTDKPFKMTINFGAYRSVPFKSGAYLFKPETSEKDILESYREKTVVIVSGALTSEVSVNYGQLLTHTVRIFNTNTFIDNNFFVENDIDFGMSYKNTNTEMFMRFSTDIENGKLPKFYSDLNGFQWMPRVKVQKIGIEGNYYPITTGAFIQDEKHRLTLTTNHAQGAAALEVGQLEVMLDRRTLSDDNRGLGEGVVDSRLTRHQFWVSIEQFDDNLKVNEKTYQLPSLETNHLINILNYPINIYFVQQNFKSKNETSILNLNKYVPLLNYNLPCDLHLFNLRTLTDLKRPSFPTESALFIVHRQGFDCRITNNNEESLMSKCSKINARFGSAKLFKDLRIADIYSTSLTGLHVHKKLKSFANEIVEPMEIKTFNLTFF